MDSLIFKCMILEGFVSFRNHCFLTNKMGLTKWHFLSFRERRKGKMMGKRRRENRRRKEGRRTERNRERSSDNTYKLLRRWLRLGEHSIIERNYCHYYLAFVNTLPNQWDSKLGFQLHQREQFLSQLTRLDMPLVLSQTLMPFPISKHHRGCSQGDGTAVYQASHRNLLS